MRRYVLGSKKAFTLIEVMVAVMIVSVVIAALFKLRGDTNHLFSNLQKRERQNGIATFLLWNRDYGLQKSDTNLFRLVDNFDMDDDLRRELKSLKTEIIYKRVETLELDSLTLEIGKTNLHSKAFDIYLDRVTLR